MWTICVPHKSERPRGCPRGTDAGRVSPTHLFFHFNVLPIFYTIPLLLLGTDTQKIFLFGGGEFVFAEDVALLELGVVDDPKAK